jgi:hypothetical protein
MREALQAGLGDVFGPRVWLHRVQANTLVSNTRSLGSLDRLGFVREGVSPRYLFVNGHWRDHVLTALVNPHWRDDLAPVLAVFEPVQTLAQANSWVAMKANCINSAPAKSYDQAPAEAATLGSSTLGAGRSTPRQSLSTSPGHRGG